MNLAPFYACKAEQKSTFVCSLGSSGNKKSLGSKNNGGNVSYIYAIIFIPKGQFVLPLFIA